MFGGRAGRAHSGARAVQTGVRTRALRATDRAPPEERRSRQYAAQRSVPGGRASGQQGAAAARRAKSAHGARPAVPRGLNHLPDDLLHSVIEELQKKATLLLPVPRWALRCKRCGAQRIPAPACRRLREPVRRAATPLPPAADESVGPRSALANATAAASVGPSSHAAAGIALPVAA